METGAVGTARDETLTVRAFGLPWRLRLIGLDEPVRERLRRLWRRAIELHADAEAVGVTAATGATEGEPIDVGISPSIDLLDEAGIPVDGRCQVHGDPDSIPYAVSRTFTLKAIRRRTGEALMLHAVGVSGDRGRTVALVAPSGTGKTTAAATLGRHLGYVTDETVVIEADDRVSPYPKPLSIIVDPAHPYAKHEFGPDELGLGPTPPDPRLVAVVALRRQPDLAAPRLEAVSLIDGILAVIPETSALPSLPDPLARLARALCLSGGPFRLHYGEIEDCLDLVRDLTRPDPARDAEAPTWQHHRGQARALPEARWTRVTWDSVLTRTGWDDAITSDGEMVILHDLVPSRLSRLGAALWVHADEPRAVPDLHAHIVTLIGDHPRSQALVQDGLQVLVDAGVLHIVDDPGPPEDPAHSPGEPARPPEDPADAPREPADAPGEPARPPDPDRPADA